MNHVTMKIARGAAPVLALALLLVAMGGTWAVAEPEAADDRIEAEPPVRKSGRKLEGKLNLNTASEEQLQRLPTIGPAKAERIVEWRRKHGAFRRVADLRRVKGFGLKTFKRLEPYLDVKGETTLR